jgi:hypothetical protein
MNIESREITYRTIVEQVFFEDGTELIIKTGWPEGQELDLEVEYEWVEGQEPDWLDDVMKVTPSYLDSIAPLPYN